MPILGIIASSQQAAVSTAFESIATITAAGGESSLSFSSIPGTYKHLQVRGIIKDASAGANFTSGNFQFNSDSGTNYARHDLNGNGSSASASGTASTFYIGPLDVPYAGLTSIFGAVIIDILDYASTSKYKTARFFAGLDTNNATLKGSVDLASGLWMSTSAINSITFGTGTANGFAAGSTFALYGING